MLDEFLERAGFIKRKLQLLGNGLVVPVLHLRVTLMEALPQLLPVFRIAACQRAYVGKLIRQPEHPNALIVGVLQDLQRFLLAPLPTGVLALARIIIL